MSLYSSLVAFWKLDEASGNRTDSVGANTLTDTNTVGNATGLVYGTAASFVAASSEYLTINDNTALSTGDVDFWVAAWFYLSAPLATSHILAAKNATSSNREFRLGFNSGDPLWLVMNNGGTNAQVVRGSSLSATGWHFMLGWHDSVNNVIGLQTDAETPVTTAYSGGSANSTAPFRLGMLQETGSLYWNSRMGPVMMGKGYVPSADDRSFLYNSGSGRTLASMANIGRRQTVDRGVLSGVLRGAR